MTKGQKRNIRQEVTDRIVAALKEGTVPWVKPWTGIPGDGVPVNATTNRAYRGVNVFLLYLTQMAKGYETSQWLTFRQAKKIGASVRKGERGTTVVFWKLLKKDEGTDEERVIPLLRHFTVFNRDQCDGMPELEAETPRTEFDRHAAAEAMIEATGADIRHGGDRACYSRSDDSIQLPKRDRFHNTESYYSAAFHELVHWTGAPSRLNREKGGRFGDTKYAFEELIAEMGAAFLCAENEISGELQHPAYIESWIEVLENDNNALFSAASKARKAADLIGGPAETVEVKAAA